MVTAELAVALPAAVLVLLLGLAALRIGIDQVRCVDAARVGARALARGDAEGTARDAASGAAPPGAVVASSVAGSEVTVVVSATSDVAGMRVLTIQGSATAAREEP